MDGSPLGELTSPSGSSAGASASGSVIRWLPSDADRELDRVQPAASDRVGSGPVRTGSGPVRVSSGPIRVGSGPLQGVGSGPGPAGSGPHAVATLAAVPSSLPHQPSSSAAAQVNGPIWHAPQAGSAAVATEGWPPPPSLDSGDEEALTAMAVASGTDLAGYNAQLAQTKMWYCGFCIKGSLSLILGCLCRAT